MLLSCVQCDVTFADLDDNLQRVEAAVEELARQSVDLAVFPECMLSGYGFASREEALQQSIPLDSPVWQRLARCCQHAGGLHIVVGFLESAVGSSPTVRMLYNATAIVGPQGVIASYRKIHLPHLGVDRWVDRGDGGYRLHQVGEARVGLAICYDCSFPEAMRRMALDGADIIALPTNWPVQAHRTAHVVPPARSMENHLYFAAANRIGSERGFQYCGLSSICGPDGIVLAAAVDDQPQILTAEIDLALARNKRIERTPGAHVIDRFADRRPEFY